MPKTVPHVPRLGQVAVAARMRALSATPPDPSDGGPPFDHALPNWLLDIAPLGADILHTNTTVLPLTSAPWMYVAPATRVVTGDDAQGHRVHVASLTAAAYRPSRHPSEAPRSEQRARESRIAEAWDRAHALCLVLHELGSPAPSAAKRSLALAETALWLSGSVTREPGVPIFAELPLTRELRLSDRRHTLLSGPRWGRNGANIVRIECAVSHDLAAVPAAQLSRGQGWKDHEDHAGRRGGASSAKHAISGGRKLLHDLGAWPWAHAEGGRLHEHGEWWRDPEFLRPLRTWIGFSWSRLFFNELQRHKRAIALENWSTPGADWSVIEEFAAQTIIALDADRFAETLRPAPDAQNSRDVDAQTQVDSA